MYKSVSIFIVSIVLFFQPFFGQTQSLSSAKKVYYTPLQEKIYFAINMNPVSQNKIPGKDGNEVTNTLVEVDQNAPFYKPNGDYAKGDILRILVIEEPTGTQTYAYIKIIGSLGDDILKKINDKIHTNCAQTFGENKLAVWPKNFIDIKGGNRKVPNEKLVDSDYYIISKIVNLKPNIISLPEINLPETTLVKGDVSNLIIFYVTESGGWNINELVNFTNSTYKIDIKYKEKVGKKGKKIGGASAMDIAKENKVATKTYEMKIDLPNSDHAGVINAWKIMDEKSEELVDLNKKYIEQNILYAIDKAFAKIK